ncbi:MAG: GyrI-like domain-containing protein [Candidatus Stahlbacteria bacterium]|nr:GyrI-like domain-containing protein [Candidatus Stahlbacteria bacterium]
MLRVIMTLVVIVALGAAPNEEKVPPKEIKPAEETKQVEEVKPTEEVQVVPSVPQVEVMLKQVAPMKFISIFHQGDYSQMGKIFGELYSWIGKNSISPVGAPFGIYYDNPEKVAPDSCRYELCVPVEGNIVGDSLVQVKEMGAMEVASTIHKGAYENVGPYWESIYTWIYTNNYEPAGAGMELYLNPQTQSPDSLLTEIRVPVKKQSPTPEKKKECHHGEK